MKIITLYCFCLVVMIQKTTSKCKKALIESYGIMSYDEPLNESLGFCPTLKSTCCPSYEQFKIRD